MIITRTPFRISFAGGGSDLKEYYSRYGGAVLNVSINKHIYLSMHPYFHDQKYFLKYSMSELVDNIEAIKHKIIKQVFKDYKIRGVDFNSSSDIPSGTGLGSSSVFTVGLINLCNAYTQRYMSKEKMAEYASEVEIRKLKEPIGKQDQYASALGGMNYIRFNQDDSVTVEKIIMKRNKYVELQESLLLYYLGSPRSASDVLREQQLNIQSDGREVENIHKMVKLADNLKEELLNDCIDNVGKILHDGWMYKKELASTISNEEVEYYYNQGLKSGATGGKLLGAGAGGFLLFFVDIDKQESFKKAMTELEEFKFHFENSGTSVIYYNEER